MLSKRFICFYLHSNEHTGCLVSLQYRLAEFRHTMHQPNLPAGILCSFLMSTYSCFFGCLSSFFTLRGTDLSYTPDSSDLIISSRVCFSSISALFSKSLIYPMYFCSMVSILEWKRHTSSTIFCTT